MGTEQSGPEARRGIALVGIRRGGVPLAGRLAEDLSAAGVENVPVGTIDISLYRDDAATALPNPKIGPSELPFPVQGSELVLVDDVLQTGRTIRAAMECLLDYGRPHRMWLVCLVDRGGRELPIAPDFVGRSLELPPELRVELVEAEGALCVELRPGPTPSPEQGEHGQS